MPRRSLTVSVPESWWLVQRIRSRDGKALVRPTLYGRVRASSETLAVEKFLHVVAVPQDPQAFMAEPAK